MSKVTLSGLAAKIDGMDQKLDRIVAQYDAHDARLRQVETCQAAHEVRIGGLVKGTESRIWDGINSLAAAIGLALAGRG
jgi:hypothetical protein